MRHLTDKIVPGTVSRVESEWFGVCLAEDPHQGRLDASGVVVPSAVHLDLSVLHVRGDASFTIQFDRIRNARRCASVSFQ